MWCKMSITHCKWQVVAKKEIIMVERAPHHPDATSFGNEGAGIGRTMLPLATVCVVFHIKKLNVALLIFTTENVESR